MTQPPNPTITGPAPEPPVSHQTDYEVLRLENQLCFALYAATRAMTKTYRTCLEPMGITYPQYLVLIVLWEADGVTVSQIGNRLRLDSGTLTPLLKRLEVTGLLQRERNTLDEREVKIWLSPKGLDLRELARDARLAVACRLAMTESQILKLRSDLMDLINQLDTQWEVEAAP